MMTLLLHRIEPSRLLSAGVMAGALARIKSLLIQIDRHLVPLRQPGLPRLFDQMGIERMRLGVSQHNQHVHPVSPAVVVLLCCGFIAPLAITHLKVTPNGLSRRRLFE